METGNKNVLLKFIEFLSKSGTNLIIATVAFILLLLLVNIFLNMHESKESKIQFETVASTKDIVYSLEDAKFFFPDSHLECKTISEKEEGKGVQHEDFLSAKGYVYKERQAPFFLINGYALDGNCDLFNVRIVRHELSGPGKILNSNEEYSFCDYKRRFELTDDFPVGSYYEIEIHLKPHVKTSGWIGCNPTPLYAVGDRINKK